MNNKFKVGDVFDKQIVALPTEEIQNNLEAIAHKVEKRSYTKNLSDDELTERKNQYSKVGIKISELNEEKREAMAQFKAKLTDPTEEAKELIQAIKYKSEQRFGSLFLIDDQENGVMNVFDINGVCVEIRSLSREERQLTLKISNNE